MSELSDVRRATNQAPPLVGHNVVTSDVALTEALARHGSADLVDDLAPLGAEAGTEEAREHGRLANRHHPELTTYDRWGNRIDEVEFHPSWHWLMERAVGHGLQAAPWESDRARRSPAPRGRLLRVVADRARARLPDLDDVRRRAGAAGRRRDRQGVDAAARRALLRPGRPGAHGEDRRARRDGHDREAGRLRRAGQPDARGADVRGRLVHPARPQVVHLGADERRLPRARRRRPAA